MLVGEDDRMAQAGRRTFETLEGLRSVGALIVVVRHVPELFGNVYWPPESFLAVDLFYLVSGVVVAHAYANRISAGGQLKRFVLTRLIRLYPLYLVGLALGLAAAVIAYYTDPHSGWTPFKLAEAAGTGLLMIPMVAGLEANGATLDGPVWTLFPELFANFTWAGLLKWLAWPLVIAIMAVCGFGVWRATEVFDQLDVGYGAGETWAALARAGYSFFAGVLILRLLGGRRIEAPIVSWLCLAALAALLLFNPGDELATRYEVAVVIAGFPALILVAGLFEPGPRVGKLFGWLGRLSWGVYLFHLPLGRLLEETVLKGAALPKGLEGLPMGAAFLAGVLVFVWLMDRFYDTPVRTWLTKRLIPAPEPAKSKSSG
jgi:peptidoglycan/LPS O-acetylase OafA/YrhL